MTILAVMLKRKHAENNRENINNDAPSDDTKLQTDVEKKCSTENRNFIHTNCTKIHYFISNRSDVLSFTQTSNPRIRPIESDGAQDLQLLM